MKPVLYLDFDNVLNDDEWFNTPGRIEAHARMTATKTYDESRLLRLDIAMTDIRPEYAARVKRIVDATGCQVVVCSNWRDHFTDAEIASFLAPHGIPFDGCVPRRRMSEYHDIRVQSILRHVASLPKGTVWCVLDDAVRPGAVGGHAVQPFIGVLDTHVDQVIRMLTPEVSP